MAEVNDELPTLLDQIRRMDPDGGIAHIVELLEQKNEIIKDAVAMEANMPTAHRITSRTALPSVGWRRFNQGITPSKSRTAQRDEPIGMLSAMSNVDVKLAKLNGNEVAFRASEDKSFLQAMNNEIEEGIFYHSTSSDPEKFLGLTPRLDATTSPAASQIIIHTAAAAGDQASMWFVSWSPDTVFLVYPKGLPAGLEHHDAGEQYVEDEDGKKFRAYVTEWNWNLGLVVRDWRYVVRIANIDISALEADPTADTLIPKMIEAYMALQDVKTGRLAIYCNRRLATYLWLQSREKAKNSTLSVHEIEGKPVLHFMGIPIKVTDALTITESVVA